LVDKMRLSPPRFTLFLTLLACTLLSGNAQRPTPSQQDHARRANEFLQAHQPEKAIPEFAALVELQPDNVDAQANLGVLLYFQGRCSEAEPSLRRAVQLDATQSKIQGLLGLCEYQLGKLDAARASMSVAVTNLADPDFRKQVGLVLVEIETAQQDLDAAVATVSKLRSLAPTDPDILYAAYRIHTDLAGESLLSLSLTAPDSGRMQQAIAHELERIRDYSGAIASLRKAIAKDSNLPGIHFELAEALREANSQSDRAQAESEYALALQKNPREVMAAVRLGDLHADRNDTDAAATFYDRALRIQPANIDAALGMARICNERNESGKSLQLLQMVLENDPANLMAHYQLIALYRKAHRIEDAKRELAEYQKYKKIKDGLHQVYSSMHIRAPHNAADEPVDNTALPPNTH
jgi:tetratricopeptide (TPR) repeat protein